MNRYEAIETIAGRLDNELVISNIGHPSQELFVIKDRPGNFYMLGSMGLASSIGLGLSLVIDRTVIVIDGDGSILMNLGTLASIGIYRPQKYLLVIIDNGAYGSTGFQDTHTARGTDLHAIAVASGIPAVRIAGNPEDLAAVLEEIMNSSNWPACIIARVDRVLPRGLAAIPLGPSEIKRRFMDAVNDESKR